MRDAMGGTVTIVIVVAFIVFALGYMAFNVNYTKAFRMKDKIISVYDKYNGECEEKCQREIAAYATNIGYSSGDTGVSILCPPEGGYAPDGSNLYCVVKAGCFSGNGAGVKKIDDFCSENTADGKERKYYKIATRITIEIPAFKNVLNYNSFYVYGDTRTYKH